METLPGKTADTSIKTGKAAAGKGKTGKQPRPTRQKVQRKSRRQMKREDNQTTLTNWLTAHRNSGRTNADMVNENFRNDDVNPYNVLSEVTTNSERDTVSERQSNLDHVPLLPIFAAPAQTTLDHPLDESTASNPTGFDASPPSVNLDITHDSDNQQDDNETPQGLGIDFYALNMRKSEPVAAFVEGKVNSLKKADRDFVMFLQEATKPNTLDKRNTIIYAKKSRPRAVLYCRKGLAVFECVEFSDKDLAVGLWDTGDKDIPRVVLAAWYWEITKPEIPQNLVDLLNWCTSNNIPCIVNGDSNAHTLAAGSEKENERGKKLDNFALQTGMEIVNTGNTPTFIGARGHSIIDHTLCTHDIAARISNWRVDKGEATLSDHRLISYTLRMPRPKKRCEGISRNWMSTNSKQELTSSVRAGAPQNGGQYWTSKPRRNNLIKSSLKPWTNKYP